MQRVRDALRQAGISVWTDEGIDPGTASWKEQIEQAIIASEVMVVLLSPSANESKWVQREIDYAELHDLLIVPMLVRGTEQDAIPFALSGAQYIDARRQQGRALRDLRTSIYQHLNQDVVTQPSRTTTRQQVARYQAVIGALIACLLLVGGLVYSGVGGALGAYLMSLTSGTQAQNRRVQAMTLRYDSRTLVLLNASDDPASIHALSFRLYENDALPTYSFSSNEWNMGGEALLPGRCTQVWDHAYRSLSLAQSPSDVCQTRTRYWRTFRTFWVSRQASAYFEVRRNGQLLAHCPVAMPADEAATVCRFDLPQSNS